jgi:hypothetical protein
MDILYQKHRFINIMAKLANYRLSSSVNQANDRLQHQELLDIVYFVTSLTMSCFIMALFYDLQSPMNDGFCGQWADSVSCEMHKTVLDPQVHKCMWITPPEKITAAIVSQSSSVTGLLLSSSVITADTSGYDTFCLLNTNTLSSRAYLLAFMITSLFSILMMCILDMVFDILHAESGPCVRSGGKIALDTTFGVTENRNVRTAFHDVIPIESTEFGKLSSEILLPHTVADVRVAWIQSSLPIKGMEASTESIPVEAKCSRACNRCDDHASVDH